MMSDNMKEFMTWNDVREIKKLLAEGKLRLVWQWEDVSDEMFKDRVSRLREALAQENITLPEGFVIKTKDIH